MTFDPRPYLDSIAEEVEWGPEIDCPATTAQRIRLAGKEIDLLRADLDAALDEILRLRADLAQRTAERDEARRMCCVALMGTGVWRQPRMNLPGGSWTPQLIAKEHGWDCFDAKEVQP